MKRNVDVNNVALVGDDAKKFIASLYEPSPKENELKNDIFLAIGFNEVEMRMNAKIAEYSAIEAIKKTFGFAGGGGESLKPISIADINDAVNRIPDKVANSRKKITLKKAFVNKFAQAVMDSESPVPIESVEVMVR